MMSRRGRGRLKGCFSGHQEARPGTEIGETRDCGETGGTGGTGGGQGMDMEVEVVEVEVVEVEVVEVEVEWPGRRRRVF